LQRSFKASYPWLNITFEVWLLVSNVGYLFDRTPFYRPWLAWTGVDLRRLGVDDFVSNLSLLTALHTNLFKYAQRQANLADPKIFTTENRKGVLALIRRAVLSSPQFLFDSLRLLLPTTIFFIKFLEWWYSPNSPARSLTTSPLGPAVPPPRMLPPHPKGVLINRTQYGQCPLCHGSTNNATALPSGYVFCYRCAYDHVETHGRCPVTLLPTKVWQLRKVMI
jgi:peroxin-12